MSIAEVQPTADRRPEYLRALREIRASVECAESVYGIGLAIREGGTRLARFVHLGAKERGDAQDDLLTIAADNSPLLDEIGESATLALIHGGLDTGLAALTRPPLAPRRIANGHDGTSAPETERQGAPARPTIEATPYEWREPDQITRRAWLYGRHYIRGYVSTTIGRPGLGKTALALAEALDMVSGLAIFGGPPAERLRVWYVGEDPADEIERRIAAACAFHHIRPEHVRGRLFHNSTLDLPPLRIAQQGPRGAIVNNAAIDKLAAQIIDRGIDVLILDPLIKFHSVPEGDPAAMEAVMRALTGLASRTSASVDSPHHTRKQAPGIVSAATVDDGRGASSIIGAVRSARVLNPMSQAEAERAGIAEAERWRYARIDSGKANMAPPHAARWLQHASEILPCGESVGVVAPWKFPDTFAGFCAADLPRVRELARSGAYREDVRARDWFGGAVADMLSVDLRDRGAKARIGHMIKSWLRTKVLDLETRPDDQRRPRQFIVPGSNTGAPEIDE